MPVARAQLDKATSVRIRQMIFQDARHDARMSHPDVEPAEIAPRAQSGLILRRQNVQQFRQDNAFHEWSNLIHFQQRAVATEAGAE